MADGLGFSLKPYQGDDAPPDPSEDPNYLNSLDPGMGNGGTRKPPPRRKKGGDDGDGEEAPPELTEDQVALAFTDQYEGKLLFCHTAASWYAWNGSIWAKENTKLAYSWARDLCREFASKPGATRARAALGKASTAGGVERFAQTDRAFAVEADVFDRDLWLLGTPGGTVDLRTGGMRPADPADRITKTAAVAPAEAPECPLWMEFLDQATGHDPTLVRFLRQWCGYTLTGDVREQSLLFLYGAGGNGKGVFLNTVFGILGTYARMGAMETFTAGRSEGHPTELAMLAGARMVCASETEEGRAWAEVRIKQLTGGDVITARFMRQDFFEFMPQFKLTIIGNHKPVLRNVDDAARRRFNIVPFNNKPAKKNPLLQEQLRAEWPGILRWMIEGCLDWNKHGLKRPQVVLDATKAYFEDQDSITQWIEECCEMGKLVADTNASLWSSWVNFAKRLGVEPGSAKGLTQALERLECTRIKDECSIRGRGLKGIRVLYTHGEQLV